MIHTMSSIYLFYQRNQTDSNSFGDVVILLNDSLKSKKIIDKQTNLILVELALTYSTVFLRAVYCLPLFELFEVCKGKECFLFGDFNA